MKDQAEYGEKMDSFPNIYGKPQYREYEGQIQGSHDISRPILLHDAKVGGVVVSRLGRWEVIYDKIVIALTYLDAQGRSAAVSRLYTPITNLSDWDDLEPVRSLHDLSVSSSLSDYPLSYGVLVELYSDGMSMDGDPFSATLATFPGHRYMDEYVLMGRMLHRLVEWEAKVASGRLLMHPFEPVCDEVQHHRSRLNIGRPMANALMGIGQLLDGNCRPLMLPLDIFKSAEHLHAVAQCNALKRGEIYGVIAGSSRHRRNAPATKTTAQQRLERKLKLAESVLNQHIFDGQTMRVSVRMELRRQCYEYRKRFIEQEEKRLLQEFDHQLLAADAELVRLKDVFRTRPPKAAGHESLDELF